MAGRDRIEGWKRIAAYFGRDESTVKRWEATRGLPVRRLPGVRSQVFALTAELEAWRAAEETAPVEAAPEPVKAPEPEVVPPPARRAAPRWLWPALAVGLAALVPFALWRPTPAPSATTADPIARELYNRGNFALEQRTSTSIRKAMADFGAATTRDPRFAPAYSGLAESWLLIREYGDVTGPEAYPRAEAAARAALAIDANDPAAHRALAFVRFWHDNDAPGARTEFMRAIALAPNDARTHLWFANMLDSAGDPHAALKEIERARLLEPGSSAIEVERIRMLTEHDPAAARKALDELLALEPRNRSALTYLAALDFAEAREKDFFDDVRREANVRGDPVTLERVKRFEIAYDRSGRDGLVAAMRHEFEQVNGKAPQPEPMTLALQATWPDH